jgi:hypothetical protein
MQKIGTGKGASMVELAENETFVEVQKRGESGRSAFRF